MFTRVHLLPKKMGNLPSVPNFPQFPKCTVVLVDQFGGEHSVDVEFKPVGMPVWVDMEKQREALEKAKQQLEEVQAGIKLMQEPAKPAPVPDEPVTKQEPES
jgi:hypothetical protein